MTTPSFNLIEEPWIPALKADGITPTTVGLRDALLQAHRLRALYAESPLAVAAMYRLLLALLYAIFGDPSLRSWATLWEAGAFPAAPIEDYFRRWHERFDLFHSERPFYQWPEGAIRQKKIFAMLPDMSFGGNATLFDHHTEADDVFFTPAEAARALLLVQTSSVSGGSGMAPRESTDAPWGRGCVFLSEGDTLFQTLMLNFMSTSTAGISDSDDRPFWENDQPFAPRSMPFGMKDYLTWPTRAVHLLPAQNAAGDWGVREVRMGPGLKLADEMLQPFYHYRKRAKDEKMLFQRFNEGRALWRDSASFLKLRSEAYRPPATLHWLAELVDEEVLERSRTYRYMVLGMANSQAKVDFYREEHFPLPAAYLQEAELVERLSQALEGAEQVRSHLGGSLSRLATLILSPTADQKEGRKPDKKDVANLMSHWAAERTYWAALEVPFLHLLQALPIEGEAALRAWQRTLKETARQSLEAAIRMAGENARALRAAVRARGQLEGRLKKLFPPAEKGEAHE